MECDLVFVHEDRSNWADAIQAALDAEIRAIGLHELVALNLTEDVAAVRQRAAAVYLGSDAAAASTRCSRLVAEALAKPIVVVPVVERLASYRTQTPDALHGINGCGWDDLPDPATFIARVLLGHLGLQDLRRVFISYTWADARPAADQLHEALARRGFDRFVDRYAIDPGEDMRDRIFECLDDFGFVLVLESPERTSPVGCTTRSSSRYYMAPGCTSSRGPETSTSAVLRAAPAPVPDREPPSAGRRSDKRGRGRDLCRGRGGA